jgi:type IV pilus biogenesis protein CpaD/CtpE
VAYVTAAQSEKRHTVEFGTDEAIADAHEVKKLDTFLKSLPPSASFKVFGRADERASDVYNIELSARRVHFVEQQIYQRLGGNTEASATALGERSPIVPTDMEPGLSRNRSVEVIATVYEVQLPACPDWSRNLGFDPLNLPLSNLGCANAANLGLMIADPKDLVRGRSIGEADGAREAEAIVRYRADKVKALKHEVVDQ